MLADDLVFNMIPLEQILSNEYHLRCDKASNGCEFLQMYLENMQKTCCNVRYRILLTDINMPQMDGVEASEQIFAEQKRLRAINPSLPEVMIVAITAHETKQMIMKCSQVGIKDCLFKPVQPHQLKFVIDYHNNQEKLMQIEEEVPEQLAEPANKV